MTSLRNCDMKQSTKKGCFIHNFIFTLDDVVKLKRCDETLHTENDLIRFLVEFLVREPMIITWRWIKIRAVTVHRSSFTFSPDDYMSVMTF
jgi:hypothetical protein